MAFGLRRWIGAVLLGMMVIAVWALPPEASLRRGSRDVTPQRAAADELTDEIRGLNQLLSRVRWLDSLDAAFEGTPTVGRAGIVVGVLDGAPAARALRAAVQREAESLGLEPPARSRVGVFLVDMEQGTHPDVQATWPAYGEYYAFESPAGPACLVIFPVRSPEKATLFNLFRRAADSLSTVDILGPCAFYYHYGPPSAEVRRWLSMGGVSFAASPFPSGTRSGALRDGGMDFWWEGLFGWRLNTGVSLDAQACVGGRADRCTQTLHHGGDLRRFVRYAGQEGLPLLGYAREDWMRGPFGGFESALLADAEAEFGAERFREFWTSELPVDEAFKASFGIGSGEWMMAWARARLSTDRRGTGLEASTILFSLVMLVLCMGGGAVVVKRRNVT